MIAQQQSLALHITGVAHGWSMVFGKVIAGLQRGYLEDGETPRYEELSYFFCARQAELTRAIIADSIDVGDERFLCHENGFQEGIREALNLAGGDYACALSAGQQDRIAGELLALREQFVNGE